MKIVGIIPARYASTRFPAKALANIGGKPMVQRVYEQCLKAKHLSEVVIATDHQAIAEAVEHFGGKYVMTSPHHPSGTDRCAEALAQLPHADAMVNIQGDEPFIAPSQIDSVAEMLRNGAAIATLAKQIADADEVHNPNAVKVVISNKGTGLYFSRSPIPHLRGVEEGLWASKHAYYRHLGIYGFRKEALMEVTKLAPSSLEMAEMLEQLRWLENGYGIQVAITQELTPAIDTPADLEQALAWAKAKGLL